MDWIKSNKIVGFPHPHVPSDHLPLMVELEITYGNQNGNGNNSNGNGLSNNFNHYQSMNNRGGLHHSNSNNNNNNNNSSNGVAQFGQMIPINNQNFLRK
jgi:hypothetical protein